MQNIAIGNGHLCVMLFDGSVECAGSNGYGQSWQGSATGSSKLLPASALAGMNIRSVGNGFGHSCVLATTSEGSDKVYCVGDGQYGQLGDGKRISSTIPVAVQGLPASRIVQLASGGNYNCVVYADPNSVVYCWGRSTSVGTAIAGTARATAVAVPTNSGLSCAVLQNITVICWDSDIAARVLESLQNVVRVAVGWDFGCAIVQGSGAADGSSVWCWATSNWWGASMFMANSETLNEPRKVLGLPPCIVVDVVAGPVHACVLVKTAATSGGEVYCWGWNDYGQLGQGYLNATIGDHYNASQATSMPLRVKGLSNATALYAGMVATCAVTASQQVLYWGINYHPQLLDNSYIEGSAVIVPAAVRGLCA